ncbi:COG4315 family predicted lipoprotein [Mycolicibacterium palauense]|uniref:COG4315 family predicted lipoprotein n=1 Tax=Mycolicibacterium palauense TaxID=2034511 RepID=UPI0011456E72|nr:hypothetical protein [Mycolicibacterium palauense]
MRVRPVTVRPSLRYRRAAFLASMAVAGVTALSGVSACSVEQERAESADQTTSTTPSATSSGAPSEEPAPTPLPTDDSVVPVGETWLNTAEVGDLGSIVVDDTGRVLYMFDKDTPQSSACYDACADTWMPALTDGDPTGGIGIDAPSVGTVERRDGQLQVTYYGHPLYFYDGDSMSGQANGQGLETFGGHWTAVNPDGAPVG